MTFTDTWMNRFILQCVFASTFSKDKSTGVGSIIVEDKTKYIIGFGFNGFPQGIKDHPQRYENRDLKHMMVLHAEQNSLHSCHKKTLEGCTLFVYPLTPCPRCTSEIIQKRVGSVVCPSPDLVKERHRESSKISLQMLSEAKIPFMLYDPNTYKEAEEIFKNMLKIKPILMEDIDEYS